MEMAPPPAPTPSQQDSTTTSAKAKRKKVITPRAKVWDHFTTFYDEERERKGKCNYCGKIYCCDSRKNGTSSINSHMESCLQNLAHSHLKQSQLSLQQLRDGNESIGVGSLTTWKFDQELCRKKLAEMIIIDEQPFSIVENEGFRDFVTNLQPKFKIPSRWIISRDCATLFYDEKKKLIEYFKTSGQTVCLTTDIWTSIQQLNYMCVTAHFIDND